MTEVVVKEIDNEEPKEETAPESIQEEAPKEEEKPEEIIEQTSWRETTTSNGSPKTQEGKTFKGETAFWPRSIQTATF